MLHLKVFRLMRYLITFTLINFICFYLFVFCTVFLLCPQVVFSNEASLEKFQQMQQDHPAFIENKGQWDEEVQYLARLGGMDVWVTSTGITYDFYRLEEIKNDLQPESPLNALHNERLDKNLKRRGHVVKMQFLNVYANDHAAAIHKKSGYYNYFIGSDSSRWTSFVGLYGEAQLKNIYSGIAARLYFEEGALRYDLIAAPDADPAQIALCFEGAEDLSINAKGELVIGTSVGEVVQQKLQAYQEIAGKRRTVGCNFKLNGEKTVGFALNAYDPSYPLIIDPLINSIDELIYSTFLGGSYSDKGNDIAVDNLGQVYVTGNTHYIQLASDFPTTPGAYDETCNGTNDVFVTKLSADGSKLIYSTFLGGSSDDWGYGIAINRSSEEVYVTGYTGSHNFPTTPGAYDTTHNDGGRDAFVAQLNPAGTGAADLFYASFLGGSAMDQGFGIAVDDAGAAYLAGDTGSSDFPTTPGAYDRILNGGRAKKYYTLTKDGILALKQIRQLQNLMWKDFDRIADDVLEA